MKLALASLLFAAPAAAFVPTASFGAGRSAMYMSTEVEAEEKVRPSVFGWYQDSRLLDSKVLRSDGASLGGFQ